MTDDIEGPITIYCQCSAVVPVPLMDAIRLAGVDDAAECVRDVQLLAAEVERVRAEDAKKRMAKK
ncbi:hypothetical protein [Desulfuromonas thiophila]|uniref:Uncharacterized protein n=2 Tax=Desulfuromonas thiophila TaxID=57664 RepID=A0A1G7B3K2_9BACT|nr:hypothetical protein [Desulfuromonas thiophila]SDE20856.1 hypothetical protein SAMN05661003_10515 [Desulfuromonas thiophila]